jgi:hypothetical protein
LSKIGNRSNGSKVIVGVNGRGFGLDVPLEGLIITSYPMEELPQKFPHFQEGNGYFQPKHLRAYLGSEETDQDA